MTKSILKSNNQFYCLIKNRVKITKKNLICVEMWMLKKNRAVNFFRLHNMLF